MGSVHLALSFSRQNSKNFLHTKMRLILISAIIFCLISSFSAQGSSSRCVKTTTRSGKECQNWTSQEPNAHRFNQYKHSDAGIGNHNKCRNPDGSPWGPWCYIKENTSGGSGEGVRWEYCYGKDFLYC